MVTSATACMTAVCSVNGNRDLESFLPVIISCIAKPAEVPDCVHKLSATVFVQEARARARAGGAACLRSPPRSCVRP